MYDLFTLVKSKLHQEVLQEVDELMVTPPTTSTATGNSLMMS
jgi:hypothetical protein